MEEFALGTPVVVANIGPLSSMVQHGNNGEVFSTASPESILQVIRGVWEQKVKLERLATGANGSFSVECSSPVNYDLLMKIYQVALEGDLKRKRYLASERTKIFGRIFPSLISGILHIFYLTCQFKPVSPFSSVMFICKCSPREAGLWPAPWKIRTGCSQMAIRFHGCKVEFPARTPRNFVAMKSCSLFVSVLRSLVTGWVLWAPQQQ